MLLPPACRASYPAADDAWTEHPDSSLVCVIEIGLNPPQCVGRSGPVNAHGRVVVHVLGGAGSDVGSVAPCNLSAEVVLESSVDESVRVGRWRPLVGEPVLGGESVDVVVVDPPLAVDEFGEARRRPGLTGFGVNPPAGRIVPGASVVDESPGGGGGDVVGVGGIDLDVCAPSGRARRAGRRSRGRRTPPIAPSAPAPGVQGMGGGEPGGPTGGALRLVVARPVDGVRPSFGDPTHRPPGWSESALASSIIRVARPHSSNEYPMSTSSNPMAVILSVITTSTKPGPIHSSGTPLTPLLSSCYGETAHPGPWGLGRWSWRLG